MTTKQNPVTAIGEIYANIRKRNKSHSAVMWAIPALGNIGCCRVLSEALTYEIATNERKI